MSVVDGCRCELIPEAVDAGRVKPEHEVIDKCVRLMFPAGCLERCIELRAVLVAHRDVVRQGHDPDEAAVFTLRDLATLSLNCELAGQDEKINGGNAS